MSHAGPERHDRLAVVVLAAGKGVRMRSAMPKVMHRLAGLPIILHVMRSVGALEPERTIVVLGAGMEAVAEAVRPAHVVVQEPPLGTGHAVLTARDALRGADGTILVVFGDTPLIAPETLARMVAAREDGAAVVALGFRPADPGQYGRLVLAPDGSLDRIVEFKDTSAAERAIGLCNGGAMAVEAACLFGLLDGLCAENAQKEYYLTDIVAAARRAGLKIGVIEAGADEVLGINSRSDLAAAEAEMQRRLREAAMAEGATLIDPATVYFSHDTKLGRDVIVGPNVFFGPGVTVGDRVTIKGFCYMESASIAEGAEVGPFARLRPGARLGPKVHVGNFVEIKNATLDEGAKANHLSYIGDAHVGARANIGAGTITCNYDGFEKYPTEIGAGAFIGSDVTLVAPVKVGEGAYVGAGSVVTEDVPADALALGRGQQILREGWARSFRARKQAAKSARAKTEGGGK
jgi:bifunctional UDP-N-acetylglucosamine pyrophosphorylase/glucosamine-1-phosphate N-acetyltransferase